MRLAGNETYRFEETNVDQFCRLICQAFSNQIIQQNVNLHLEIEPRLNCILNRVQVRHVISTLIDEALRAMPNGGTLDIAVVRTSDALEIEVADSGELDGCDEERIGRGTLVYSVLMSSRHPKSNEIHIETAVCPQGGLARTVVIPLQPTVQTTAHTATNAWRRAA